MVGGLLPKTRVVFTTVGPALGSLSSQLMLPIPRRVCELPTFVSTHPLLVERRPSGLQTVFPTLEPFWKTSMRYSSEASPSYSIERSVQKAISQASSVSSTAPLPSAGKRTRPTSLPHAVTARKERRSAPRRMTMARW